MAYAFTLAGFEAVDVHMTDLQTGRVSLADFAGVVACGGFSYGDTLGAGIGWARSIVFNERLAEQFKSFFARPDTFGLGVCNGCQMFAELADIIPGAQAWPRFTTNQSERFEARLGLVEVLDSPSLFFKGMAGARLPIAVAHGEGFANFARRGNAAQVLPAMRFVDNLGQPTEAYPFNPNGSPGGLTAVTTADGRFTAMMPHPERVFRNVQMSWTPGDINAAQPLDANLAQRQALLGLRGLKGWHRFPGRSWPASECLHEAMSVARHDSLAGKLLQIQNNFPPVGAGLPANACMRPCPLPGTIRLQASSYKYKTTFPLVGAGLPAIFGMRRCPLPGTIRLQASSYQIQNNFSPCRSWPASDFWHAAVPVARHDSRAGKLLQIQNNFSPCRSWPASECLHEAMSVARHDSLAGKLPTGSRGFGIVALGLNPSLTCNTPRPGP